MLLILSSSSLLAPFSAPEIRIVSNHPGTRSVRIGQTKKPSFLIPHHTCDPVTEAITEAKGLKQGHVVGTASINLAEFVSDTKQKELQLKIPLTSSGAAAEPCPSLCGLNQGPVVGTASVNLAEFVSDAEQKELQLNFPLTSSGAAAEPCPSLCVLHAGKRNKKYFKTLIVAEYTGVKVKLAPDFEMGVTHKTPEYLKLNPALPFFS